jgi:phosphoribosylaminoimidazolecarboxamide formyltransferase/IMP cyclohydrolase
VKVSVTSICIPRQVSPTAAKNHERVTLVCDPADYQSMPDALQKEGTLFGQRKVLAVKGFKVTAHHDARSSDHLAKVSMT